MSTPLAIPAPLLVEALRKEFPWARISPRDSAYAVPMLRPLMADLAVRVPDTLRGLGLPSSWSVAFDCDKYAGLAKSLVALRHRFTVGADEGAPEGVAFGELLYRRRDGVGHAVNVVFALDEGAAAPAWFVIEPQTGGILELSDAEKQSAWEIVL